MSVIVRSDQARTNAMPLTTEYKMELHITLNVNVFTE